MFKRANKITALLVAAAAVVSLVPATGVNAADVKRIESEDGTVYGAVAYKDGKFLIDGEVDGKDEGVYFLNNGKYTELEDLDTGSEYDVYGEKYATVDTDDYYVDLSSGKVTDDSIAEDETDDAATALRKKVKKDNDDRYTDDSAESTKDETNMKAIAGNKFGEIWYETSYELNTTSAATTVAAVYTDAKGAYIDADYNVGKIKIKDADGKTTTLENTVDTEDFNSGKADVKVTGAKVLGQDKNYIYRLVDVTITAPGIKAVNGVNLYTKNSDGSETVLADNGFTAITDTEVSYKAIQKISKAQASDDIDGIKYAKTVTTYALTDEDGKEADSNALIINPDTKYSVVDGKVVAYNTETSGKVSAVTISLKIKAGYNYTDIADESTEDADVVDVDVDGNIWRLDSGNIYKFNNDEDWDKVYKVDGAMDNFVIYDKNNFVVWNEDDEVYSIVGGKTTDKDDSETPEVKVGWVQNADGTWIYNKEDGTKATGWLNLNGTWYYLKADGIMATGWVLDGSTWYYTNASGAMQTGWINVNGTWYYTNASGAMQTGWINDNGTWYYCNASGAMLANTTVDGYVLGANGAWVR